MNRLLVILLFVLIAVAIAVVAATSTDLPARMAVHFGASGVANGWQSRDGYEITMIALIVALPLLLVATLGWLPRIGACMANIPNKDYWLAPARREGTFERLTRFAALLGVILVVFLTAVHLVVVEANTSPRPTLPTTPFIAVMLAFAVAMIAWVVALTYGFRRPA
jgi:uncharacterized membrane protein